MQCRLQLGLGTLAGPPPARGPAAFHAPAGRQGAQLAQHSQPSIWQDSPGHRLNTYAPGPISQGELGGPARPACAASQ